MTSMIVDTSHLANRVDPFELFLHLADTLGEGRSFLLEAAAGEGQPAYRMSMIGVSPLLEVQVKDGIVHVFAAHGLLNWLRASLAEAGYDHVCQEDGSVSAAASVLSGRALVYQPKDPLAWLECLRAMAYKIVGSTTTVPFSSGLLGYLAYDAVHYAERLPKTTLDDRDMPDIRLQWHAAVIHLGADRLVLHDGLTAMAHVLSATAFRRAAAEVDAARAACQCAAAGGILSAAMALATRAAVQDVSRADAIEDVEQAQYESGVCRAKEYIAAGDIFQVVLSRRIRLPSRVHAYVAYDRLRRMNPSPYMFVADYPDMRVFGASPEVQFRSVAGRAEMKPIAGTSKGRGLTKEEDDALRERLQRDEKELAEHVMLVDLCRNDLGRVCRIGSIETPELMMVEPYSHLFHLVSVVRGELRADVSVFHALLSTFPAGTLSGAPKIRAMQIIDELERLRRGPYGGMIGMIDFAANANTAIVIRTVIERDGWYHIQVGAGIVADSVPTEEWKECGHKAGATLDALTGTVRQLPHVTPVA